MVDLPSARVPLEEALPGFEIHVLPEEWTPLQAFVLVKSLDAEGHTVWAYRTSEQMNLEELYGALLVQAELVKVDLLDAWAGGDE